MDPLAKKIKALVRPAVAHTRRKELEIKHQMPSEAFYMFLETLRPTDTTGLERDATTGAITPTTVTGTLNRWHFEIRKGSVSDRLFHLEDLDPPAPSPRCTVRRHRHPPSCVVVQHPTLRPFG